MRQPRSKTVWTALLIVVAICGLGSRKLGSYLPRVIAAYTGDAAWALAVFVGLGLLFPRLATWRAGALALAISFVVEASQLYHAAWIDAIRNSSLGHLALGSGFEPTDLACYTVGVAVGVFVETLWIHRSAVERS